MKVASHLTESATAAPMPVEIPYRIGWQSRSALAGVHRTSHSGSWGRFRSHASLLEYPDPRRIDVRRSLVDPFDTLYVRRLEYPGPIDVIALLDISGSMSFRGRSRKMALAADLIQVLSRSARRIGDRFGLYAFGSSEDEGLTFPPTRSRSGEDVMAAAVRDHTPVGGRADGLLRAAEKIGRRRRLVILISDFLFPLEDASRLFELLEGHDVVPILLRDSAELESLPPWGLVTLQDLETGRRRLLVLRPKLKATLMQQEKDRITALSRVAAARGCRLLEIRDQIDWDRLAGHLAGD